MPGCQKQCLALRTRFDAALAAIYLARRRRCSNSKLSSCICECLQAGKPFLGICLGMQLLFDGSEENGGVEGLGIIPGRVTKFDTSLGLPVPHIGWNNLDQRLVWLLITHP